MSLCGKRVRTAVLLISVTRLDCVMVKALLNTWGGPLVGDEGLPIGEAPLEDAAVWGGSPLVNMHDTRNSS
jgi:hypothetical protein